MLDVRGLTKKYRNRAVVDHVTFSVPPGEVTGYLGPNGSGKSTTVKMLAGLLSPTSGQILWNGVDIRNDLIGFKRILGYVPEEAFVYPHLTGLEHLELIGRLRQLPESLVERKANELLRLLWLHEFRYSPISSYSKGMKQRVLIAGALLHDPDLLILDEPLSGLDITSALLLHELIAELSRKGKTILYISHVLEVTEKVCSPRGHALPGEDCRQRRSRPPARPDEPALARADLPPAGAPGRCRRCRPPDRFRDAGELMKSAFALLAGHFFGRFFDNDIVSQRCDMRTNVVQALGLLAVPGMFVGFYMLPQMVSFRRPFEHNWLLIGDYYFFVLYSMVVMGFVMVLEWDALFPDRTRLSLPDPATARRPQIFFAKLTAPVLFLGSSSPRANLFSKPALIGPIVATDPTHWGRLSGGSWVSCRCRARRRRICRDGLRRPAGGADQPAHRARLPPHLSLGADGPDGSADYGPLPHASGLHDPSSAV